MDLSLKMKRSAVVCHLTLFNARRGGEPSRLTLKECDEADNNMWIEWFKTDAVQNSEDKEMLEHCKVVYQKGKNNVVPCLIMSECVPAIRILADPLIRKDAKVNEKNIFLFFRKPCHRKCLH